MHRVVVQCVEQNYDYSRDRVIGQTVCAPPSAPKDTFRLARTLHIWVWTM